MKNILLVLAASSLLAESAEFADEAKECKACAGDKDAKCICKDAKSGDAAKDKASCSKSDKDKSCCSKAGQDAKAAPSAEKKK